MQNGQTNVRDRRWSSLRKEKRKKRSRVTHLLVYAISSRDSPKGNDLAESIVTVHPGVSVSCTGHALGGVPLVVEGISLSGNAIKNRDYVPLSTPFVQVNRNSMKFRRIEISLSDLDKPLDIVSFFPFYFSFFSFLFVLWLSRTCTACLQWTIFILFSVHGNQ